MYFSEHLSGSNLHVQIQNFCGSGSGLTSKPGLVCFRRIPRIYPVFTFRNESLLDFCQNVVTMGSPLSSGSDRLQIIPSSSFTSIHPVFQNRTGWWSSAGLWVWIRTHQNTTRTPLLSVSGSVPEHFRESLKFFGFTYLDPEPIRKGNKRFHIHQVDPGKVPSSFPSVQVGCETFRFCSDPNPGVFRMCSHLADDDSFPPLPQTPSGPCCSWRNTAPGWTTPRTGSSDTPSRGSSRSSRATSSRRS